MSACDFLHLHASVYLSLFSGEFVCEEEDQKTEEAVKFLLWYQDKNFSCLKSCCMTVDMARHALYMKINLSELILE